MVLENGGWGPSAAVSIAAIRAVFDYYQEELYHETLGNWSIEQKPLPI